MKNERMAPAFVLEGTVIRGKQLGRELGFPTANLPLPEGEIPENGVYAARVCVDGGEWMDAILNQGAHPTFAEGMHTVEIHLLDRREDLYDRHICVEYLAFLREEKTFSSGQELSAQIAQDVQAAKEILAKLR